MSIPKGFKYSAEAKTKMSEAQKKRYAETVCSDETRAKRAANQHGKKASAETRVRQSEALKGRVFSVEHRANLAKSRDGKRHSDETRKKMSEKAQARSNPKTYAFNYRGGKIAEDYAAVLCKAGFIREYVVVWGDNGYERFRLDFAHIEGKVNIELDGKSHNDTKEHDALRDSLLKTLGWRVIRIKV